MALFTIDVGKEHWLGERYANSGWRRLTLFLRRRNWFGDGSMNWPIAEIDVVDHPSKDGCNAHTEIKISIRNEIRRNKNGIDIDGNRIELRHPEDIVERATIDQVITKLGEYGIASEPLAVYVCMRHVEKFWVEGDFWSED
jgi:hypothetical protein